MCIRDRPGPELRKERFLPGGVSAAVCEAPAGGEPDNRRLCVVGGGRHPPRGEKRRKLHSNEYLPPAAPAVDKLEGNPPSTDVGPEQGGSPGAERKRDVYKRQGIFQSSKTIVGK